MEEELAGMEKIEFNFPILMKVGTKVRVNKSKVDQAYFECPDYIMDAEEGEVIAHAQWTPGSKVVTVQFNKMGNSRNRPMSYNLPNSYLEVVK